MFINMDYQIETGLHASVLSWLSYYEKVEVALGQYIRGCFK